jgi:hypothetical protein
MPAIFNYRSRLHKTIGFVFAYAFILLPVYAATSDDIANGVAAYNKGWYSTALHYLTLAESQYPNNALIHYYLANTLVHLTKMTEAMTEYYQTVELDPNGATGNYARQALQAAGSQSASSLAASPAQYSQPRYQQYGSFNSGLNSSQRALLAVGDDLSHYLVQHGLTLQTSSLEEGQKRYKQFLKEEQVEVERMNNAGFYDANGIWTRAYTPSDIAAYKQGQEAKAKHALSTAVSDARAIASLASQRANAIRSSASALANELVDPQAGGKILLSPVGTNLYVRNYLLLTPDSNHDNVPGQPSILPSAAQTNSAGVKSSIPIQR